MTGVFLNLTACAALGSLCGAVFYLLRPATRRILGPENQYRLWILLLILWVLPLRFTLPETVTETFAENIPGDIFAVSDTSGIIRSEDLYFDLPADTDRVEPARTDNTHPVLSDGVVLSVLRWIWAAGIPIAFLMQIVPYIRFRKVLKHTSLPLGYAVSDGMKIPVCRSFAVDSPMVAGIFRPVLYLPERDCSKEEYTCILRHEMTHAKRGDIPLKWFAAAVRCLHWWNPLVHLTVCRFAEECEISCDFRAAADMGENQRKVYMKLLLDLAEAKCRKREFLSTGFSDSRTFLKRRLMMIQNGKKQKIMTTVLSSLLLAGLSAGLIYAGGVFRDSLLPEETDAQENLPVVETLTEADTAETCAVSGTSAAETLESLKEELTKLQQEIGEIQEETEAAVGTDEEYEAIADDVVYQHEEFAEIVDDIVYQDSEPVMHEEMSVEIPAILKPDRDVNLPFGMSNNYGKEYFHNGVDFEGEEGESIPSASAGEIVYMGYEYDYGNLIIVKSGAFEIFYAHLSGFNPSLQEGDIVEIGTILGEIGHTGATTGPHLHFEIRLNSQPIDPASLWAK